MSTSIIDSNKVGDLNGMVVTIWYGDTGGESMTYTFNDSKHCVELNR
jgi:hypothetical protein